MNFMGLFFSSKTAASLGAYRVASLAEFLEDSSENAAMEQAAKMLQL